MEHGATRNYEIWNDRRQTEDAERAARAEEEEGDAMKWVLFTMIAFVS